MLNVCKIKELVDEITGLDDFLKANTNKNYHPTLRSSRHTVPVPEFLVKKWFGDLLKHREKLSKKLLEVIRADKR